MGSLGQTISGPEPFNAEASHRKLSGAGHLCLGTTTRPPRTAGWWHRVSVAALTPTEAQASRGALWFALQSWVVRLTTLAVFTVLGRLLAPADFGLVALANVFVMVLSVLVQRGVGSALVQLPDLTRRHLNTAFFSSAGGGLFFCGALAVSAPYLSLIHI